MREVVELIAALRPHVADERVLEALAAVPRDAFVPRVRRGGAWENRALAIACGQTISQPLVVARMAELLAVAPGDRVLDVGTGSGYHAAVLAALGARVWSIERHPRLSRGAARALQIAGVTTVTLVVGDGAAGFPRQAPFDAINVAAATPGKTLAVLEEQLGPGGRLVAPLAGEPQRLVRARRTAGGFEREAYEEVRFVPLIAGEP
ncbi:MAG: protein-L-isoaspartate(D-aspartate) O-methyltransferase [Actinomycetota bacterium]|nr:protein-L-isoaspartate(D-aspartate) O-methyltransferase [Actinomycetota bacterium]